MNIKNHSISVVVPVYNERGNIGVFHHQLVQSLERCRLPYEIIYVDDHSTDDTYEYIQSLVKRTIRKNASRRNRIQQPITGTPGITDPVVLLQKKGKKGKAFSLVEGFSVAKGSLLVMIDGDLQYSPDEIPSLIQQLQTSDVVVANRKHYKESWLRKTMNKTFRSLFGEKLFGLKNIDVQSGLKAFTREAFDTVSFSPSTPWTFDLEFLSRAHNAGFSISTIDITFAQRQKGASKVRVISSSLEIAYSALKLKTKRKQPFVVAPEGMHTMKGAGVRHKKKTYITHTTLPVAHSALTTFTRKQIAFLLLSFIILAGGLATSPLLTAQILVSVLSLLYFADTVFQLFVVTRSLQKQEEIQVSDAEVATLVDNELPVYTILCPLYKEAHVVPQFLKGISALEWPKDKLDVMFLLEEDDTETIAAFSRMDLPFYARTIIVPHSQPKTKPKACNYGLAFAKGEYLVIYDAEDLPDPLQLKKAYLGFQKVPEQVKCLQAKLNYYNGRQNLLTRFFTAEYSLWFDIALPGIQGVRSTIPLGGTSNHFRTENLHKLQGWDPFNVTEDADLGIRLFQRGYQTAIIDSTTYEEATSNVKNWLRQRSRWIKGYMQTYLVHMRSAGSFIREKGLFHHLVFQMMIGGKLLFILLNPLMWVVTFLYFAFHSQTASLIEAIYKPPISYLAVFSWIFGNFLFLYYYMIGIAKRQQWDIMKYVFLVPLYWVLMSIAAFIAFYQLLFKPHYWEKTIHGFHLLKKEKSDTESVKPSIQQPEAIVLPKRIKTDKYISLQTVFFYLFSFGILFPLDVFVSNYFLPQEHFVTYLLLASFGKALFIASHLLMVISLRLIPAIKRSFQQTFFLAFIFHWVGFILFGVEASFMLPLLFETTLSSLIPYLPFYLFMSLCLGLAYVLSKQMRKSSKHTLAASSILYVLAECVFIFFRHDSLMDVVRILSYLSGLYLFLLIYLMVQKGFLRVIENNTKSFFSVFQRQKITKLDTSRPRILILNWRDTKHIYTGGAEVYVHELAKRWVIDGCQVTLFCGNDQRSKSNEIIDGVEIVRRGGTYTVYLFALLYYLFRFNGKYDVIVDSENGLPFFTPLYSRTPVILLIHHVHQEVFRTFLQFPLNYIASFLEGKVMPLVYRNRQIITVSESSRNEIMQLGFTKPENITIIPNGLAQDAFVSSPKTSYPSFVYVGRLKAYKNVEIAIRAFAQLLVGTPTARFSIVGSGECFPALKKLVKELQIEHAVTFWGRVSEEQKKAILAQSWMMIQPSEIEGWGITVLEANAAGTPVIASRVNGLRDSVVDGETGVLVEVRNVDHFAQAMHSLVYDSDTRSRLSFASQQWAKYFDWDKSAEDFLAMLEGMRKQSGYVYTEALLPVNNQT